MSYNSLHASSLDSGLQARTVASVQEQARLPQFADTAFAAEVTANPAAGNSLIWPVALNVQAAYEAAYEAGDTNIGANEGLIPDAAIMAAVQAAWPMDPAP